MENFININYIINFEININTIVLKLLNDILQILSEEINSIISNNLDKPNKGHLKIVFNNNEQFYKIFVKLCKNKISNIYHPVNIEKFLNNLNVNYPISLFLNIFMENLNDFHKAENFIDAIEIKLSRVLDFKINLKKINCFNNNDIINIFKPQMYRCVLCFFNGVEILFEICNHLCLCKNCAKDMSYCPICSQMSYKRNILPIMI